MWQKKLNACATGNKLVFYFGLILNSTCFVFVYQSGGTAVGTGLNTKVGFAEKIADSIATYTGMNGSFVMFIMRSDS